MPNTASDRTGADLRAILVKERKFSSRLVQSAPQPAYLGVRGCNGFIGVLARTLDGALHVQSAINHLCCLPPSPSTNAQESTLVGSTALGMVFSKPYLMLYPYRFKFIIPFHEGQSLTIRLSGCRLQNWFRT